MYNFTFYSLKLDMFIICSVKRISRDGSLVMSKFNSIIMF